MGVAVMGRQPAAFMSYVRFNDQHDDGQLTQFRERLAAEVRVQTGEEFAIFQDRNDIAWGQKLAGQNRGDPGRGDAAAGHHHPEPVSEVWSDLSARPARRYHPGHDHVGGLVLDHLWQAIKPSRGHRHRGASSHAW